MTVRTRFAPSPTGYMHIGGMRTALFNWLFARHNGGTFVLRIDDTDQQRNLDSALGPILQAFRWLGLDWDEGPEVGGDHGPYFQSQRQSLYVDAMQRLLQSGHAYRDFEPAEETRQQREAAEQAKTTYRSSRQSLDLPESEVAAKLAAGEPHVVRFVVPRDETVVIKDHIRGTVEFDCGLMPDPVIARNDGSPLYNFATAVDDAALQISHVIRAEEHLSNTPVQALIHRALGHPEPQWAHIPFVAAPGSKEKLSKRKIAAYRKNPMFRKLFDLGDPILAALGQDPTADALSPVMVEYYEQVGFLPAGVLNALFRLGWSLDDQTEVLPLDTVIREFSLERVNRSPAGLDPDKLISFQSHWIGQLSAEEKLAGCLPYLSTAGWVDPPISDETQQRCLRVIELAADRLRVFGDILQFDEFFLNDSQVKRDDTALQKRLRQSEAIPTALEALAQQFDLNDAIDAASANALLNEVAAGHELKAGKLFPAVRLCVSGKSQGPDLFRSLELIGGTACARRIRQAVQRCMETETE